MSRNFRATLHRPRGITRARFSALVSREPLNKIEATLDIPSRSDGFRSSLTQILWRFYCNSVPETRTIYSRAGLKKEMQKAARLAEKLETSAELIWKCRDMAALEHLARFTTVALEGESLHPSGIGWIGLLHEFARTTKRLADTLPDDPGGPRPGIAFDELVIGLTNYYREFARSRNSKISEERYFRFVASVVDVLQKIQRHLPAADFKLPKNDKALRQRLRRLTKRSHAKR
jgi:hypothetical protein